MKDTTLAFDSAALGAALCWFGWRVFNPDGWQPVTELQRQLRDLYAADWPTYDNLQGVRFQVGGADQLNQFRQANHLEPCFNPVRWGETGIGVATILELFVEAEATAAEISIDGQTYRAFKPARDRATVVQASGFDHPVARIHANNGAWVWLTKVPRPVNEVALFEQAINLLSTDFKPDERFTGVKVPSLHIDKPVDVSPLLLQMRLGEFTIEQAHQQVRLQISGGIAPSRTTWRNPLVFDSGFLCAIVRQGSQVPSCVLYAAPDSWHKLFDTCS